MFSQNKVNKMINSSLKNINLQSSIELDKVYYKNYGFDKVSLPSIY